MNETPDARTLASWQPEKAAGGRVLFMFCLWAAALTTVRLVGRRYIDPGSGSFAIQVIIAAVLGGLLTARLWIRHVFWRIFGRRGRSESDDQPSIEEADR
ncbi:MAG: hypothetical protein OXO54_13710 [Chloroflexota bacterium]|nr:hypothetical protein [Chloroflexota bacterium]